MKPAGEPSQEGGQSRGPRRRKRLIGLAVAVSICAYVLLNCSGLSFPIWNPRAKLESRLTTDLGFTLPTGVTLTRASRVAYVDPAEAYLLQVPGDTADPLITPLREAARQRGNSPEVEDNPVFRRSGRCPVGSDHRTCRV